MKMNPSIPALRLRSSQAGFTLVEMMIATTLLGLMSLILSPSFRTFLAMRDQAYAERQTYINTKLSQAMLAYAKSPPAGIPVGSLPPPYSYPTGKIFNAPVNMTGSANSLWPYAQQQGLSAQDVNDDGTPTANLRVYQRATGLGADAYMFYQGGPSVRLTYELGAIYMTKCARKATCNSNSTPTTQTSPVPTKLSLTSYATWAPPSDASGLVFVSTLPLQKEMLELTAQRLDRLRESFINYFKAKGTYPSPLAASPMETSAPSGNLGCRNGWYQLDAPTVTPSISNDIPLQIGISQVEDTRTAWGGPIYYCQDYDPSGTSGRNAAPHYAALLVRKAISEASPPDVYTPAENIIVSF